jgi:hypothetical protein
MIKKAWRDFVDAIDYIKLFRRVAFLWVLWLTTQAFQWAMQYANTVPHEHAVPAAAMIAAILTPIAGVQAWVMKIYVSNSMEQIRTNQEERTNDGV